jgi:hypothetical protein
MANYKKWTDAERDYIRANHKTMCDEELAKVLKQMTGEDISTSMVRRQRRHMSLKKERGRPVKEKKPANVIEGAGRL